METNFIFAGFGGQGVLLAGTVLANAFITHSSPMPEAEEILTAKLKERGFKNIYNTLAGGTISSHCGPNCIGVLFLNN